MIWIQKNSNGWFGYHTIGNGIHEHSDVNPIQKRHQESEDEPASGNREEWTPISDTWWSASRWTDSWWEKSRWTWSEDFLMVFRTQVVVTSVCATGCVHTSFRTHISLLQSVEQVILIHFSRVCTHARLKHVEEVCRDSPSRLLPSDVSPICSAAF